MIRLYRTPRDLVTISGADAASYLQGQCSQEIEGLGVGASADTLILSPQGKVEVYGRLTRQGEQRFLLDLEAGFGGDAVARLERFRLRVAVDIAQEAGEMVAVVGAEAVGALDGLELATGVVRVARTWPEGAGVDLVGSAGVLDGAFDGLVGDDAVVLSFGEWELLRIEAGEPQLGREVTTATIAAEVGLVDRTVSFTKGCFTGQELVARVDSRGSNVARRLARVVVPVAADAGEDLLGAIVEGAGDEGDVGSLTSVTWSPERSAWVALATLGRKVQPPTAVVVRRASGSVPAMAEPLV